MTQSIKIRNNRFECPNCESVHTVPNKISNVKVEYWCFSCQKYFTFNYSDVKNKLSELSNKQASGSNKSKYNSDNKE